MFLYLLKFYLIRNNLYIKELHHPEEIPGLIFYEFFGICLDVLFYRIYKTHRNNMESMHYQISFYLLNIYLNCEF
jgi:hypothetical protein